LAKAIVDIATDASTDRAFEVGKVEEAKNPHAMALGRLGGLKGGNARAKSLTAERRSEIARKAAKKRWGKK
jgi:hypothetical protein